MNRFKYDGIDALLESSKPGFIADHLIRGRQGEDWVLKRFAAFVDERRSSRIFCANFVPALLLVTFYGVKKPMDVGLTLL